MRSQGNLLQPIATQASQSNREAVSSFVARCLPGHGFPEHLSSEEFAQAVQELRKNERGWNQSLCAALIRADDLFHAQGARAARASLEAFAISCPWALFADVARNQAAHYKAAHYKAAPGGGS